MLRSVQSMRHYALGAKDDEVGTVHDFLFDSETWKVRYLVADTGKWLPGRKVLIAATAVDKPNWEAQLIPIELTKEQVRNSPDIEVDKPVSRQKEIELHKYYGWIPYWGAGYGGVAPAPPPQPITEPAETEAKGDPNLRSCREVKGYHLHATEGEIGHVDDFIVDDEGWSVRYLVVDTRNWLPGKDVLISPQWVGQISWEQREVYVDLTKETVKHSPTYDPSAPVNREYETRLYDYYGRPKYWV